MRAWPAANVPELPGRGPELRLYDSADRQIRPVASGQTATMYVCGITPYDATHLGHAATYLAFDLVYRLWLDSGHDVHYVQNITDVDDPLFERARRDGVDWRRLGDREVELFRTDMAALRVLPPHEYVAATEAIEEVVEVVEKMLASGAAYIVDDPDHPDVYFRARATAQFGYESNYDRATMERLFAERGGDPGRPGKADALDALLWSASRDGEPSWPSPFGPGRPGWHVECAAIALSRIGTGLDIQGGGTDLIFPHHEFSAAHAECVTGERRFARHYVHAGMIGWDGQKMSKSRGNLVLVSMLRKQGVEPAAIRLGLLAGHYRADREWSAEVLDASTARLSRWRQAVSLPTAPDADDLITRVRRYLADDLDTPKVIAALDGWATDALEFGGRDVDAPGYVRAVVDALLGVTLSVRAMGSVDGKVVLITGGARGIGAETARRLHAKGAKLVLTDLDEVALQDVASDLDRERALMLTADVRDLAAMQGAASRAIERFGGIDVVVANAGIGSFGSVLHVDPEAFRTVIDVNLIGVFNTVRATLPSVIDRRGYVLIVSSMAAYAAGVGLAAYTASKAGAENFASALRMEVAHRGVAVGSAHMSWIDTPLVRESKAELASFGELIKGLPAPLRKTTSVQVCADVFVDGIEGRKRRVNCPRWVGLMRWLKPLLSTPMGERQTLKNAPEVIAKLDAEVAALGRSLSARTEALERRTTK